jgi:hypothetical protein
MGRAGRAEGESGSTDKFSIVDNSIKSLFKCIYQGDKDMGPSPPKECKRQLAAATCVIPAATWMELALLLVLSNSKL